MPPTPQELTRSSAAPIDCIVQFDFVDAGLHSYLCWDRAGHFGPSVDYGPLVASPIEADVPAQPGNPS